MTALWTAALLGVFWCVLVQGTQYPGEGFGTYTDKGGNTRYHRPIECEVKSAHYLMSEKLLEEHNNQYKTYTKRYGTECCYKMETRNKCCAHTIALVKKGAGTVYSEGCKCQPTIGCGKCEDGWEYFKTGAKCYKFESTVKSHDDAATYCTSLDGAKLVELKSANEATFVKSKRVANTEYWIGVKRAANSATLTYSSGGNLGSYSDWSGGTPGGNALADRAVYLASDAAGLWTYANSAPGTTKPFICQRDAKP